MVNCLIVGAGQLGSRHLQGLLRYDKSKLNIIVIDPSEKSLWTAKERAGEIQHNHIVSYSTILTPADNDFLLGIVATNSLVREQVTLDLLAKSSVKYLILEKVLFPKLSSYQQIAEHLKDTKCYVNHTRRILDSYITLKESLKATNNLFFQVVGSNWGLGCNGLHFIDLIEYLSDSTLETLDLSSADKIIHNSKREGYVEFTGTIKGRLRNNNEFLISSINASKIIAPAISIQGEKTRILIQETVSPGMFVFEEGTEYHLRTEPFVMKYQSELTGLMLMDLVETGTSLLPTYQHASLTHQIFVSEFLNYFNEITHSYSEILPIT